MTITGNVMARASFLEGLPVSPSLACAGMTVPVGYAQLYLQVKYLCRLQYSFYGYLTQTK